MKVSGSPPYSLTEKVAITGLGGVCSLGNSIPEITGNFISGKSGIGKTADPWTGEFNLPAARAENPPAIETDIHPQLARSMGKHLSLLLASTQEALRMAGIGFGLFDPREIAFFAGMGMVDYHIEDLLSAVLKSTNSDGDLDYDKFYSVGCRDIYPLWPLGMLNNVIFCQASIHFGLRGENCVFSPHGDAGIQSVVEAARVLVDGKAKVALAGGISEEISFISLARARLNGLVGPGHEAFLGECGAMLILEPLSGALERGAGVLARIAGYDFSCGKDEKDGFTSRQAIESSILGALSHAALEPGGIDLVMLGSLGQNEIEAVREIFGSGADAPAVASTAGAMGEMFAAGPILNIAIGLSISDLASLPLLSFSPAKVRSEEQKVEINDAGCFTARSSARSAESSARYAPAPVSRMLVNGISYEGRCASLIIEKTPVRPHETSSL
jgi:3-oxoacyl-(acyl-carrier-protein) synthase